MLERLFSIFHSISGKIFWFSSAYFPSGQPLRTLVEKGLLRFYQWELRLIPDLSDAYSKIASLLANRGQADEAVTYYTRALQTNHPDAAKINYFIGKQKARQGDLQGATVYFKDFVRIAAESHNIKDEYVQLWSRLEDNWEYKPCWFDGYFYLGNKCLENGLNTLAIEFLRKSVTLEPLVIRAHRALAETLYLSNCRQEAARAVRAGHYFQLRHSHPELSIGPHGGRHITKPDFMILGVKKCGTTSLYRYLTQHPCIPPAFNKEIEFFYDRYDRGMEWYLAQFPPIGNKPELITGEASVEYIESVHIAELIKQDFPDTRFIILLRNPVERAISQYHMYVRLGLETGEIEKTLLKGVYPASDTERPNLYVEKSTYVKMLKPWIAMFPREQFLILSSEQLFAAPGEVSNQVFEFLQQAPFTSNKYRVENKGQYALEDACLRQKLHEYFLPHNKELEEFLDMQFDWSR